MRKITSYLFVVSFLLFAPNAFGDILYLKDGKKVAGEIMEERQYSIKIKVKGVPYTYYQHEIEKVERDRDKKDDPKAPKEISPELKDLVLRLLEANGVRNGIVSRLGEITAKVPEEQRGELEKLFKVDDILERFVPIYAKYYTEEELKVLLLFYKGPVGQKQIELTPQVIQETMQATVQYFQEKSAAVGQ